MRLIAENLAAIRELTGRLAEEVTALTDEEWARPACGEWSVAVTLTHLARQGPTYGLYFERARHGISEPPPGGAFMSSNLAEASRGVADRSREFYASLQEPVLEAFVRTGGELLALVGVFSHTDWEKPTFHPAGVIPAWGLLEWRLAELSLHRWDILTALGREAGVLPAAVPGVLSWLKRWLKVGFRLEASRGSSAVFKFMFGRNDAGTGVVVQALDGSLTWTSFPPGPSGASDILVLGANEALVGDVPDLQSIAQVPAEHRHIFQTNAETLILILAGRISFEAAMSNGRLRLVRGSEGPAEFRRFFGTL